MFRSALITPGHRDTLRRLKKEFEEACAAVPDFSDRTSPEFLSAQDLYRTWIKAIDAAALALLDDLDAAEGIGPVPVRPAKSRGSYSPVEAVRPGEVDGIFAEIDEGLQARNIVDASERDEVDIFGL